MNFLTSFLKWSEKTVFEQGFGFWELFCHATMFSANGFQSMYLKKEVKCMKTMSLGQIAEDHWEEWFSVRVASLREREWERESEKNRYKKIFR